MLTKALRIIDWPLLFIVTPLLVAGLITMKSFGGGSDYFFWRQFIWIALGLGAFFAFSALNWRFFKSSGIVLILYLSGLTLLVFILLFAKSSWFRFPLFAIQPSEPMKIIAVLLLAKYFSRRHVDIARFKHIIVSAIYAVLPALLIFFQPDLGSALIFGVLWLGMIMASGISKKHLSYVLITASFVLMISWFWVLEPYQKLRVTTFLNPYLDPQGAGYNALQAQIAVGSGGIFGRGVGYGSQSRLEFLPEHETDFIFAAFAEEWGLLGSSILILFFIFFLWHILSLGMRASENFVRLYTIGFSLIIIGHFVIHVGMNIGLLPITGLPLSFVSYGGSHLITLFAALGIWNNMRLNIHVPVTKEIDIPSTS